MPMMPTWYDDTKAILIFEFSDPHITTWDEYHDATDAGWKMIQDISHEVFVVMDAGDTPMPKGNPMPHLRRSLRVLPQNVPIVINIVDNMFAEVVLNMLEKIQMTRKMIIVNSWDETHTYINNYFTKKA